MCFGSEPPDNWKITDEIRRGERGAGYLYKQGKSRGNWSKRYFVLTDYSLRYYADSSRANLKGEIVLVGATCQEKPSFNKKKMFHFSINHPKCASRLFYAPSKSRKEQWLNRLSDILANIDRSGSIFGTLHKKGGLSKTNWQERWCVLAGNNLDYYESAQDSLPKGSIGVHGAKVRDFSLKDKEHCIEIVAQGRKGLKKYSFCCDTAGDKKLWLSTLKRISKNGAQVGNFKDDEDTQNPMQKAGGPPSPSTDGGSLQEDDAYMNRMSTCRPQPEDHEGYLMKKSPAMFTGWQKRYCVLREPGELCYWPTMDEYNSGADCKGSILIAEINPEENAVQIINGNEIKIKHSKREFHLQARDAAGAEVWLKSINEWMLYLSSVD